MNEWTIFHNPRCSKSRASLALLKEHQIDARVVEYLNEPLSEPLIIDLIEKLGVPPRELVRQKETAFGEVEVDLDDAASVARAIVEKPVLLQRPVVVFGERAVIGRPPENIIQLFQ